MARGRRRKPEHSGLRRMMRRDSSRSRPRPGEGRAALRTSSSPNRATSPQARLRLAGCDSNGPMKLEREARAPSRLFTFQLDARPSPSTGFAAPSGRHFPAITTRAFRRSPPRSEHAPRAWRGTPRLWPRSRITWPQMILGLVTRTPGLDSRRASADRLTGRTGLSELAEVRV